MTKEHGIGRYEVKRGERSAPIPKIRFLKAADGTRGRRAGGVQLKEVPDSFLPENALKKEKRKRNKTKGFIRPHTPKHAPVKSLFAV